MTDGSGYPPPGDSGGYGNPGGYGEPGGYGDPGAYGGYGAGYGGAEYGVPYGYAPPDPGAKSGAMVAFVVNAVLCAVCCGVPALPGLICAGIALSRSESDPESARKLTKWSWISMGIVAGLIVVMIATIIVLGITGALDDNTDPY